MMMGAGALQLVRSRQGTSPLKPRFQGTRALASGLTLGPHRAAVPSLLQENQAPAPEVAQKEAQALALAWDHPWTRDSIAARLVILAIKVSS